MKSSVLRHLNESLTSGVHLYHKTSTIFFVSQIPLNFITLFVEMFNFLHSPVRSELFSFLYLSPFVVLFTIFVEIRFCPRLLLSFNRSQTLIYSIWFSIIQVLRYLLFLTAMFCPLFRCWNIIGFLLESF